MLPFRELVSLYGTPLTEEFSRGLTAVEKKTERIERVDLRPTEKVLMVHGGTGSPSLKWVRWGFPKGWNTESQDPWKSQPLINTKAETALERITLLELANRSRPPRSVVCSNSST